MKPWLTLKRCVFAFLCVAHIAELNAAPPSGPYSATCTNNTAANRTITPCTVTANSITCAGGCKINVAQNGGTFATPTTGNQAAATSKSQTVTNCTSACVSNVNGILTCTACPNLTGNFSNTCTGCTATPTSVNCANCTGSSVTCPSGTTTVNNCNGALTCGPCPLTGNFSATCTGCTVTPTSVTCASCSGGCCGLTPQPASITCPAGTTTVTNCNGALICGAVTCPACPNPCVNLSLANIKNCSGCTSTPTTATCTSCLDCCNDNSGSTTVTCPAGTKTVSNSDGKLICPAQGPACNRACPGDTTW